MPKKAAWYAGAGAKRSLLNPILCRLSAKSNGGTPFAEGIISELAVRSETDVAKVTLGSVPDTPGIAAGLLGRLGAEGFNLELMVATGGGRQTTRKCTNVNSGNRLDRMCFADYMRETVKRRAEDRGR